MTFDDQIAALALKKYKEIVEPKFKQYMPCTSSLAAFIMRRGSTRYFLLFNAKMPGAFLFFFFTVVLICAFR